ncbi:hypothetical protein BT69DRAFT_1323198 [Atractiella rhizophila]|nr:hypothetical protein BT69DRAFT_1323198 [Atractiella rhizophila]
MSLKLNGSCLCGSITYDIEHPEGTKNVDVYHCFCDSCCMSTGAFFQTFAKAPRLQIHDPQSLLAEYSSRTGVIREFCKKCSTPLTYNKIEDGQKKTEICSATLLKDDIVQHTKLYIGPDEMTKLGVEEALPDSLEGGCFCGHVQYSITNPTDKVESQLGESLKAGGWPDDSGKRDKNGRFRWTITICHCDQCRLWSSSPATPFLQIPNTLFNLRVGGQPVKVECLKEIPGLLTYRSSPQGMRVACPKCYTSLLFNDDPNNVDIACGTIKNLPGANIVPERHIWLEEESGGPVWRIMGKGLDDGLKCFKRGRQSEEVFIKLD